MTALRPKPSLALSIALLTFGLAIAAFGASSAQAAAGAITCPASAHAGTSFTCTFDDNGGTYLVEGWSTSAGGTVTPSTDPTTATVTFSQPTSGTVSLTYSDTTAPSAGNPATTSVDITNTQPAAVIAPSPLAIGICNAASVNGSASSDPDGDPLTYSWWADSNTPGNFGSSSIFGPTFATPGAHTIGLQVSDSFVASPQVFDSIQVNDAAPTAAFTAAPGGPTVGQKVTFDASTSKDTDPCDTINKYSWDLNGDGKFGDSTSKKPSATYATPGNVNVQLRVTDKFGTQSLAPATATIAVGANSPAPVTGTQPAPPDPAPGAPTQTASVGPAFSFPIIARRALMSPFPVVRIRGRLTSRGVVISLLTIRAPRGALVTAKCSGKGCPKKALKARASKKGVVRLRKLERSLRAGVKITIYVTQKGRIGKYTRFTILKGKAPTRRDLCTTGSKAAKCPTS